MLEVSQSARELLKDILEANSETEGSILRFSLDEKRKLGIIVASPDPNDEIIEHEGAKILALEEGLSDKLDGIVLDTEATTNGSQLVVKPKSEQV